MIDFLMNNWWIFGSVFVLGILFAFFLFFNSFKEATGGLTDNTMDSFVNRLGFIWATMIISCVCGALSGIGLIASLVGKFTSE